MVEIRVESGKAIFTNGVADFSDVEVRLDSKVARNFHRGLDKWRCGRRCSRRPFTHDFHFALHTGCPHGFADGALQLAI